MSIDFTGVTFPQQKVTPSDDAIARRAMLSDGILTGCALSYAGTTLTMGAGHLMICGRQVRHPSPQNWAVTDASTGFARLVITVDVTRTSTRDSFDQVNASIDYAASEDGFDALEQADINGSGLRYQVAACIVSLGAGGITGIVSQLEPSAGGGASLNFKIVGGETQPSGVRENTIWVTTPVRVSGWVITNQEPEAKEGLVWISTGTDGEAAFSATKGQTMMIYPAGVQQYIGGAWESRVAQIYKDGRWIEFSAAEVYLYNAGRDTERLTGGWMTSKANPNLPSYKADLTLLPESMQLYTAWIQDTTMANGALSAVKLIDLSKYSGIELTYSAKTYGSNLTAAFAVTSERNNLASSIIKRIALAGTATQQIVQLDLTGVNSGYVCIFTDPGSQTSNLTITVHSIRLIK